MSTLKEKNLKHNHKIEADIMQLVMLEIMPFQDKVFIWRNNTGALKSSTGRLVKFGAKGSPDFIGMTNKGLFVGIECKAHKGQLREEQQLFKNKILKMNGEYLLIRGEGGLEELRKWLRSL